MLTILIKKFKKVLMLLIMAALITTSLFEANTIHGYTNVYCANIEQATAQRKCEVIIRAGEYKGKPGKRIYLNNQTVKLPKDIPLRNDGDGNGFYVHEHDINVKEAKALVEKLRALGIDAKLQIASDKTEDLNAAGRISNKSNPYLYISIHHNYYNASSKGYFGMYNTNDTMGKLVADRLTNSIKNNNMVPQTSNRPNTGYIGELNKIHNTTTPVLLELGFFSNPDELEYICSNQYVNYVSDNMAKEIEKILNEHYK